MKKTIIFLLILMQGIILVAEKSNISIIPKPNSIKPSNGFFEFNENTKLYLSNDLAKLNTVSSFFSDFFTKSSGIKFHETDKKPANNYVGFIIDHKLEADYYELSIKSNRIIIRANNPKGIFWGIQSLRQLLPVKIESSSMQSDVKWKVPNVEVKDQPRFGHRGLMLDVGRYFYSVDEIKKLIDIMALYKLNNFHWHLTDDQGWRIEIKKYPLLTEVGSWRRETLVGKFPKGTSEKERKYDCTPHAGFYTQEQIKEVVEYAEKRFITIIPEIEMPGHATAALASYPEYGCTGGPYEVATKWGVHNDVFCPKETTFEFLENILQEVMDLFPGKYIHIGGDECPKVRWKNCAHCQNLIKSKGLADEKELQSYFIGRISSFLESKGRKMIGWDEILEGGLAKGATVMSWRGTEGGISAAMLGNDVIMTPRQYCYFDYYQSKDKSEPLAIGGFVPVDKVYNYNPIPKELPVKFSKHIIGVQANLWTEFIADFDKVQYMLLPRLLAMAEVQWTCEENKNYTDFLLRAEQHKKRLDILELNYARHIFE